MKFGRVGVEGMYSITFFLQFQDRTSDCFSILLSSMGSIHSVSDHGKLVGGADTRIILWMYLPRNYLSEIEEPR